MLREYIKMTSRISKGSITGRSAFNSGGLGLSIGSRVGGARRMISARAPDGGKMTVEPKYKFRTEEINYTVAEGVADNMPYITKFYINKKMGTESSTGLFTIAPNDFVINTELVKTSNTVLKVTICLVGGTGENNVENYITAGTNEFTLEIPSFKDTAPFIAGDITNAVIILDINSDGKLVKRAGVAPATQYFTLSLEGYQLDVDTTISPGEVLRVNTEIVKIVGSYKFKLLSNDLLTINRVNVDNTKLNGKITDVIYSAVTGETP